MQYQRSKLLALIVALGAVAVIVIAATPRPLHRGGPEQMEKRFAAADRDGNGALSPAEFEAMGPKHKGPRHAEMFTRLDQNRDGQIQKDELKKAHEHHEAMRTEHFQQADKNGDGKLSRDEFLALTAEHHREHAPWQRMDTNGDGKIERTELPSADDDDDGPPHRPRHNPQEWFALCDTNSDGVVDASELEAHHSTMREQAFTRMDENQDGYLDKNEWRPPHGPGGPHGEREQGLRDESPSGGKATGQAMGTGTASLTTPARYLLAEAYPNPFNNATTIRYDLPEATDVTLAVYNVAGELVKTLVAERQGGGSYKVELTLENQTSGQYFCRLQAGSFQGVTRLTYLK